LRRQLDFSSSLTSTAVPELSPRRVPRFAADQESRVGRRETDGTFPVCFGRKRPVPSLRASSSWERYVASVNRKCRGGEPLEDAGESSAEALSIARLEGSRPVIWQGNCLLGFQCRFGTLVRFEHSFVSIGITAHRWSYAELPVEARAWGNAVNLTSAHAKRPPHSRLRSSGIIGNLPVPQSRNRICITRVTLTRFSVPLIPNTQVSGTTAWRTVRRSYCSTPEIYHESRGTLSSWLSGM
jgi:hypothetical protein